MRHLRNSIGTTPPRWQPWAALLLLLLGFGRGWAQTPEKPEEPPAPLLEWGETPEDIPEGYMIIEGDIQVPIGFDQTSMPWATNLWPGGVVPFEFDANVTPANQAAMRAAMAEWESVANVRFIPRRWDDICYYVHIQDSDGNNSPVGRQLFPCRNTINIASWNSRFTLVHELAHTLGFWHEQSRTDRDSFVRINWANIQPGQADNFAIENGSGRYGPYDFDSVMHYHKCAFSIACPPGFTCACPAGTETITVLPPNEERRIGQQDHLSRMDRLIMGFHYPFGDWRFVDRNYTGAELGTFRQPYRDFIRGVANTPNGGTLWVQPGTYFSHGTYTQPMTWQAPLGSVTLN